MIILEIMKKLFATLSLLSFSFPFFEFANANEYDFYSLDADISADTHVIYGVKNGARTLLNSFQTTSFDRTWQYDDARYDQKTNSIIIPGSSDLLPEGEQESYWSFDLESHAITELEEYRGFNGVLPAQDLIRKQGNVVSIGENSLKLKETASEQQLWGTNADGKIVPLNITNGSKLLINGRDVEQSINNVGALSAALTGLPTVPTDTTLACGLGTGTHGGDFAFSGGCASKINDKLAINYAASMTMPGQDYAGDFEDTFSARAGFVWKLGKSVKPTQISMKDKQKLTSEIKDLKSENKNLNEKITKFEIEKLELLARLERLEKIALSETNSQDLATIKLP